MWLFLATLAQASPPDPEALTPEAALARARNLQRAGLLEITAGTAATAGGLVVMLVGRGPPGEISTETQAVSDLRSIGGSSLLLGGLLTTLVGGDTLGRAKTARETARALSVSAILPTGEPGVVLSMRR